MLRSISLASIRFRYIVLAITAGLFVAGITQLHKMHVDVLPETSPAVVNIQTDALGLSAPEVEALVTVPLEKNLLEGVLGVNDVTSQSIPGLSDIQLHFAPGTNIYQARQLVQERLSGAFVLPNVSSSPVMLQPESSTGNVMLVGLTSTRLSLIDLSVLARWTIVPQLLGVPGVADVATFGQADRQLQVQVNPSTLQKHHVSLDQVVDTAGNSQLVSPLSFLTGSTPGTGGFLEGPNQRITIRHVLPFDTPKDLAEVPLSGVKGKPVPLGTVAHVVLGHQPLIGDALVHGRPGLVLEIEKLPSANVQSVTRGLDAALAQLKPSLTGVRVNTSLFRPASYLSDSLGNLRLALILFGVLAALALLALFASFRQAFIALLAIAISLTLAVSLMQAFGYTFNSLVTLGLLLAVALVVDDAVGSCYSLFSQLRQDGSDQEDHQEGSKVVGAGASSAVDRTAGRADGVVARAVTEFRGPLCTAAVVIVLAAAPVALASGLTANFLRPMVLAFVLALAISVVAALLVTPALAALLYGFWRREPHVPPLVGKLDQLYRAVLNRAVRMPKVVLPGLLVLGLLGLIFLPFMHPKQPSYQDRNLVVSWSGAPGMSLTEMNRVSTLATHELMAVPGVQNVAATIGRAVSSTQIDNTNSARLWVTIKPDADYDATVARIKAIGDGTPGIHGSVNTYETDAMSGVLGGAPDDVVVRLYGPEYTTLRRLAAQVKVLMSHVSGVHDPRAQLPTDQPTLDVQVNLNKASKDGVLPGDVRREAGTLVEGLTAGNFFEQDKVFDVVVVGQPSVRNSVSSVDHMLVDTSGGHAVPLGSLAHVTVTAQPNDIQHQAMSRYVDVTARVSGTSAQSARSAVAAALHRMTFPQQYYAAVRGGPSAASTGRLKLVSFAIAALVGLILLAQAVFGSWRLALIVLATLPLPIAAAALTAFASSNRDSLAAAAALLGVLAITIRQAFRMVAAIRARHRATQSELTSEVALGAAAAGGGGSLAGAVVTVVVLLPLIFMGNVPGIELLHTAALVLLVGVIVATVLNLLVLPLAVLRYGPTDAVHADDVEREAGVPAWTQQSASDGLA
jgi:Cu/Ag efflux pump CusA